MLLGQELSSALSEIVVRSELVLTESPGLLEAAVWPAHEMLSVGLEHSSVLLELVVRSKPVLTESPGLLEPAD